MDLPANKSIMYASGGLLYFLQNAKIYMYSEGIPLNIMDLFPFAKKGYVTILTCQHLLNIYLNEQDENNLLGTAFIGTIPVTTHIADLVGNQRMTVAEAVQRGLISPPYNTMNSVHARLNGNVPNLQQLIFRNYLVEPNVVEPSTSGLHKINTNHPDLVKAIEAELELADGILSVLDTMKFNKSMLRQPTELGKIDVYSFLYSALYEAFDDYDQNYFPVVERFFYLRGINLLYVAIILKWPDTIKYYLTIIDPRQDNHKAYFLAEQTGDGNIINMVKNSIIERNLLEQEVFRTQIIPGSNLGQTMYSYTQQL